MVKPEVSADPTSDLSTYLSAARKAKDSQYPGEQAQSLHPHRPGWPRTPTQEQIRTDALLSISRRLSDAYDEPAILRSIVELAHTTLGANRAAIGLIDPDRGTVTISSYSGFSDDLAARMDGLEFSTETSQACQTVVGRGQTLVVDDIRADSTTIRPEIADLFGITSLLVTPIKHHNQPIGAIYVDYTTGKHEWTPDEVTWLQALADQSATVLKLGRVMREQRQAIAVRDALHTASQHLQDSSDLDTVIEATLRGLSEVISCVGSSLHLLSEDGSAATIVGLWGYERSPEYLASVIGHTYEVNDSSLNRRTLVDQEAFFLRDFQVEAGKWPNLKAPTLRAWISVPLIARGRCLGKITLDHDKAGVYGPQEVAIVQTFASHAASAIERANLYAQATARADRLAAINEIGQELVAANDLETLYATLYSHIASMVRADTFFIGLADDEHKDLDLVFLVDDGDFFQPQVLRPKPGPTAEVLHTGLPLLLDTAEDWKRYSYTAVGHSEKQTQGAMFVPLKWRNLTLGVVSVQSYSPNAYTQDDFQTLQALGTIAALALARVRSEQSLAVRASQFAALADSARALVSNLDLRDVLQTVAQRAHELIGGRTHVFMHDTARNVLGLTTSAGEIPPDPDYPEIAQIEVGAGVTGLSFAEQKTIVVQDIELDERVLYRDRTQMRSMVASPLSVGAQKLGVLVIRWLYPNAITQERLALCTTFADHAALAIYNAKQHDELRTREEERTQLLHQILTAQEDERKRISLELHDGPLQSLSVGLLSLDLLRKQAQSRPVTEKEILEVRTRFASIVEEVRGLMTALRPEVLDAYGLESALHAYTRTMHEATGINFNLQVDLPDHLPPYIEVAVYRLVQEALTNVRKHSGANNADILICHEKDPETLIGSVKDDGAGFNPKKLVNQRGGNGIGLKSMKERSEGAGGYMELKSKPGQGTEVTFSIPIPEPSAAGARLLPEVGDSEELYGE